MGVFDRPSSNFYGKNKKMSNNREPETKVPIRSRPKSSLFSLANKFLERPREGGEVNGEKVRPESTLVAVVLDSIKGLVIGNIELFMKDDYSIDPVVMKEVAKQLSIGYYAAMEGIIEVKTDADKKINTTV